MSLRLILPFILLSGCAGPTGSARRAPAEVHVTKLEPPAECRLLRDGMWAAGRTHEEVIAELRAAAASLDADWLTVDARVAHPDDLVPMQAYGRAYACPAGAAVPRGPTQVHVGELRITKREPTGCRLVVELAAGDAAAPQSHVRAVEMARAEAKRVGANYVVLGEAAKTGGAITVPARLYACAAL